MVEGFLVAEIMEKIERSRRPLYSEKQRNVIQCITGREEKTANERF